MQTESRQEAATPERIKEPIAIIGIGCRFPGGGNNPESFWTLLKNGVDTIVDVPPDRWDLRRFYDPNPDKPGKMYVRQGGFLQAPIDRFDAQFFGISPREAARMDPQQRLLLEAAWEALEDAGLPWEGLKGSETGVYIGGFTLDTKILHFSILNRRLIDSHTPTSGTMTMLANRISYAFDFRGPSVTMDTACSASLVAFHYACQSIWNGECPLVITGGVNIMLRPEYAITMSKGKFLSPDGRCKTFDARADGYARGEGAGVVVLKGLSAAQADGDPIYALVRGTGINQDGYTPGITLPNVSSQMALMRRVYAQTGVASDQIQYIEAHGTGTQAGDTTEAAALGAVLGEGRPKDRPCLVGSVKTNIGHLEAAAGIAGIIKTALCLKHGMIPPNLHFKTPNPAIPFESLRLRVPQALEPWPHTDGPHMAGVNSFGYGGTNAHVLLEAADPPVVTEQEKASAQDMLTIIPLSARSEEALKATARAYLEFLSADGAGISLRDFHYSTTRRRTSHAYRFAAVGASCHEIIDRLKSFAANEPTASVFSGHILPRHEHTMVFVYAGMGPQWWAMGRELLDTEPIFRRTVEDCDVIFQRLAGWSLMDAMLADETVSRMNEPEVAQPANFALQLGLTELLRSWGIEPGAVTGHSVGEAAAACVSGALSLEEAVTVIYHRSRVQQTVNGQGRMLATGLSEAKARDVLEGLEGLVSIAGVNSPESVVLSGDPIALEEIAAYLENEAVYNRFLNVDVAYHSCHMDPLQEDLVASLRDISPRTPRLPLYSTVTGRRVDGVQYDAAYWWENVRQPVRFSDATDALIADGNRLFMEIGPHPVLSTYIRDRLTGHKTEGRIFSSLHRKKPDRMCLLETICEMYCAGYAVAWPRVFPDMEGRYVRLPSYPWQREPYFYESDASREDRLGPTGHPLLGQKLRMAEDVREIEINSLFLPYLQDHRIEDKVVFPGAAYVEAGLALDRDLFDERPTVMENLVFHKALILDEQDVALLHLSWDAGSNIFSIYGSTDHDRKVWTLHASGHLLQGRMQEALPAVDLDRIRLRCIEQLEAAEIYARLNEKGLHYGPYFRNIKRVWRRPDEMLVEIRISDACAQESDVYRLHPTALDAGFQALIAAIDVEGTDAGIYMPVGIDRIQFYGSPEQDLMVYGRIVDRTADTFTGDLTLCDTSGEVLVAVKGLQIRELQSARHASQDPWNRWLYELQWQPSELPAPSEVTGTWLIFEDKDGVGGTVVNTLESRGARCIRIISGDFWNEIEPDCFQIEADNPSDYQRLIEIPDTGNLQGCLYLRSLEGTSEDDGISWGIRHCTAVTHLAQALAERAQAPRLILMTSGTQRVDEEDRVLHVAGTALWGLGRVIMTEHPELSCRLVDLDHSMFGPEAFASLSPDHEEEEICIRHGVAYVRRLVHAEDKTAHDTPQKLIAPGEEAAFELEITRPGMMDSLKYTETTRRTPGPGEIEIEVHTVALNFKDILKVMGMLSNRILKDTFFGNTIGMECSGTVVSVGEGVNEFRTGDRVAVITGEGCFRSFLTVSVDEAYIVPVPEGISMEEAPVLVPYLTVYYGLHHIARLEKGERILIHAASGGVGLAAVYYAQSVGAEIFATAGSPEKRSYLTSLGVRHIMDSRSLAFADEVMALTDGHGVHVVLNSLPGEWLTKSLSVLAPYGRFIEIGKRDIDENSALGMRPFNRNLTFAAVDGDRMLAERRDFSYQLLRAVCKGLTDGSLRPLRTVRFPASEVTDAFRYMAQARHIGKVVVNMQDRPVTVTPAARTGPAVTVDGTYMITGGSGGFGLETARWLASQGARYIVLVGRNGAVSPEAKETVAALASSGVTVRVARADVSNYAQVSALMSDLSATMPPLRGVIHAAGVLADERLMNLDRHAFETAMAPKAAGAWHLHRVTQEMSLDFFILFSSISSIIGNAGQGNYAAANAYLDGLAHHRRGMGLPAMSINWGPLTEVGMAARQPGMLSHLEHMGIQGLTPGHAMEVLGYLMKKNRIQTGVMNMDWHIWGTVNPTANRSPRFLPLLTATREGGDSNGTILYTLSLLDDESRRRQLQELAHEEVARVLKLPKSRLDVNAPLMEQGMDSLMAVEVLTAIRISSGVELSQVTLMKGVSVVQLAQHLNDILAFKIEEAFGNGVNGRAVENIENLSIS